MKAGWREQFDLRPLVDSDDLRVKGPRAAAVLRALERALDGKPRPTWCVEGAHKMADDRTTVLLGVIAMRDDASLYATTPRGRAFLARMDDAFLEYLEVVSQ